MSHGHFESLSRSFNCNMVLCAILLWQLQSSNTRNESDLIREARAEWGKSWSPQVQKSLTAEKLVLQHTSVVIKLNLSNRSRGMEKKKKRERYYNRQSVCGNLARFPQRRENSSLLRKLSRVKRNLKKTNKSTRAFASALIFGSNFFLLHAAFRRLFRTFKS